MTATIPLAQPYSAKKIKYPGYLSVKLDGVPVRVDLTHYKGEWHVGARTRQDEVVHSTEHALTAFASCIIETGLLTEGMYTFVFEVTHTVFKDFKDVSGVVRRQSAQDGLVLNLFDCVNHTNNLNPFSVRSTAMQTIGQHMQHEAFSVVPQYAVKDAESFKAIEAALLDRYPHCEGLVYRAADAVWNPGSRLPDYMKVLNEPMSDVEVLGFEEAVSAKTGEGLGMVGGIRIRWKDGEEYGVGPGKLTHDERKKLWYEKFDTSGPHIAQIKHKRDDTYKGPRQGTFQCWRPEKKEPSYG